MIDWLLLFLAALAAGAINALAGGGSFITLPALIFFGVPPGAAHATGAAAVLPGYFTTVFRFRGDIVAPPTLNLPLMVIIAAAGGVTGAALLLATGDRAFAALVPWLLLIATLVFAAGPLLLKALRGRQASAPVAALTLYAICTYGGYFNGGMGIFLLAALGLLGVSRLLQGVAVKAVMSATLTTISVAVFAIAGVVHWPLVAFMAAGAVIGGYTGASLGYRIDPRVHRVGVVVIGLVMSGLMFLR